MSRPALTVEQKKKIRNDIREAALRLRAKHGPHEITVRAVAAEAGISVGTFYTYYETLGDLAQSLWREPVQKLRLKMEAVAKKESDPLSRIRKMMECYAKFEKDQNTVYRGAFLFVRSPSMSKPVKEELAGEVFYCLLHAAIIEGQKSGQIRDGNPDELAQTLWASIHGALAIPVNLDRYKFFQSQKLAKIMIRFLVESLSREGSK